MAEGYQERPTPESEPATRVHATQAVVPGVPFISWGAIFAGLVVVLSMAWLFYLLGLAMGVSIADATDSITMQGGLTIGTTIWVIVSWLLAFFIGSLVAARLAGRIDDFSGMLHGLVLWGIGTLTMLVLTYWGISSLLQTGQAIATTTVSAVGSVATGTGEAVSAAVPPAANATQTFFKSEFGNKLQDRLVEQASKMAASVDRQLTPREIRSAISDLDERTLRRMALDLTNDDQDGAVELLADNTELSEQDARALIDGAYRELEEAIGDPSNSEPLSEDLQNELATQVDSYVAALDAQGPPEVTEQEIRTAIDRLDSTAMEEMAGEIITGDSAGAKRVLVRNTNLSRAEIDELYNGAMDGVEEEAEEYGEAINEGVEAVSTYISQVLWISFTGAAIALAVSLGGGWLGADSTRRAINHA